METPAVLHTADELLHMSETNGRYELVLGELRMMVPPGAEHSRLTARLVSALVTHVEANRLGVAGAEGGFLLSTDPDTVRAPDAYVVRQERIPPSGVPVGYWNGAPDLAVEVISPSDSYLDVQEKVKQYLTAGSQAVWVINPRHRTLTVYTDNTAPPELSERDVVDGGILLPGFRFPIGTLFSR